MAAIRPFAVSISDEAIADLHARLDMTRWPSDFEDPDWTYGASIPYFRDLVRYWRHEFSWREAEARMNHFDQYLIDLDGLDMHFIHQRSPHANAVPLLMCHGWPGSVVEFLEAIPRLTTPELYGGSPDDAFHVVCPSLPGYGFSAPSKAPGLHHGVIAERHHRLMVALGYDRYMAQGGDWGSSMTQLTAMCAPEHCRAIHLNLLIPSPVGRQEKLSLVLEHERVWLEENARHEVQGMGYYHLQSTRPNAAGIGLSDSPAGTCAWIAEKFHYWTDCVQDGQRDIRNAVSWDALLTNVSLYWFTNSLASSIRLYKERALYPTLREMTQTDKLPVPFGVAIYPSEAMKCPKAWAEERGDLIYWSEPARGGHFAAMEQPQIFAEDLWAFARSTAGALGK